MNEWRCEYCSQVQSEDALFCAKCGAPMPEQLFMARAGMPAIILTSTSVGVEVGGQQLYLPMSAPMRYSKVVDGTIYYADDTIIVGEK